MAIPYIVFSVDDPHFTILEENEAHAARAMVKREDTIGHPLLEAFPGSTEEYVKTNTGPLLESIRQVIKTGKSNTLSRLAYNQKDEMGRRIQKYWSVTHFPFVENKKVTAIYQTSEDVTDEVLADQKHNRTKYCLDQALSGGAIGTWVLNIEQGLIIVDKNLALMFGLAPEGIEHGLPLSAFILSVHPQDRERVELEINNTLKAKGIYKSEFRTIDTEGEVKWVIARGSVAPDEVDRSMIFSGVVIDITNKKQAENNLKFITKVSKQFSATLDYKQTLSSIASMIVPGIADWCTVDLLDEFSGQLEQVVVAHKDARKVTWAKEIRAKRGVVLSSDSLSGTARVIRTGKAELYPVVSDEMLVRSARDKEELKLMRDLGFSSAIIAPLVLDNKPIGAVSFIATESRIHYKKTDLEVAKNLADRIALVVYNARLYDAAQNEIKKRKQLQQELQTLNTVLERRVKQRTKELEATNKGLELEINKRRRVENDLKKYSKSLAISNQELQDFAYIASHDLQEPLRKIQAFGDILEKEYSSELGDGMEYLGRMKRAASRMSILINDLLQFSRVNAKATPYEAVNLNTIALEVVSDLDARIKLTKGVVNLGPLPTVWAEQTRMRQLLQNIVGNALKFHREGVAPVVDIMAKAIEPTDKYYTIYIIDNGIGFEEKYLDRIFSVFQRLHSKDMYEGTGIGLAICRKITERYGGSISATSKKGVGSKFIIKIPIINKE